jgi:hypothetical protein
MNIGHVENWILAIVATLLVAMLIVIALTVGSFATVDGCAVVLKTPDGFLNVRAEPKMGSRILKRLKPGEIIATADLESAPNGWEKVYAPSNRNPRRYGWVYRFIADISDEECERVDP